MKVEKIILGLGLTISLWGCGPSASEKEAVSQNQFNESANNVVTNEEDASAPNSINSELASENANMKSKEEGANDFISSSAAIENKDTTRKFIRTADLKFKVKSVIKSTLTIEKIALKQDGFVSYTKLESVINNVTSTLVSADSSLETTYYTVKNDLIIRVPNTKLDTTLKEISKNIDYLDYRVISAEDVSLLILRKKLAQKRLAINADRMKRAIEKTGKKLTNITEAEDALLNRQEEADNEKLSNLELLDKIKYSTITLSIYQRQSLKRELIANDKNIDAYEPSFASKVWGSMRYGLDILKKFILFLAKMWGLILIGIVAVIIYKKFNEKSDK